MSMWLVLAKIEVGLLEAVRADPQLLNSLLFDDVEDPLPDNLSAAFDSGSDRFEADYRTLSAIADVMPSREWFDKATGEDETESLDYDDLTYGPAFALGPQEVSEVATGLVAEGWYAGGVVTIAADETEAGVERSARALGEAAEPEEIAHDEDVDLAAFFSTAAAQGRAIVGGVN